ncbi:hypothetical protein CALCODRAFT_503842 [Calocera cornea HHB12733]|uniref:Endonuclease/exonuclease/phosphatase domain-containing protein n=1 Tax=Calocera cornea HHB12733 TaxID=1353952 RepID=A0A165CQ93_9BASI|nr:hypothetical protein CALCODRAFT_503842 [Calocera cornea HHB12733]
MNTVALHPLVYNRPAKTWDKQALDSGANTSGGSLLLFTWNINGLWDGAEKRLAPCLDLLKRNLKKLLRESDEAEQRAIICIQEFHGPLFQSLLARAWIRDNWIVIAPGDIETRVYDCITLVSKNLVLSAAFLMSFRHSHMGRRAIFVDLPFDLGPDAATALVRVGNTHLESMDNSGTRRLQLEDIASQLRRDIVHCGIIGGDLNANAPSDEHLADEFELSDVWDLGVGDEDAMTWGWTQKRFPHGRFDKFLLSRPDRMPPLKAKLIKSVELPRKQGWISDHHCLLAILDCSLTT